MAPDADTTIANSANAGSPETASRAASTVIVTVTRIAMLANGLASCPPCQLPGH